MRRFYAAPEQFSEDSVQLNLEESRHLRDVLRLRDGDEVSVFDGGGREFLCRIETVGSGKKTSVLSVLKKTAPPSLESKLNLTLAIALLKGEKFDLVVQKATELGVTRITPLITKRADVRIKDPADTNKKLERWRKIALEAAKQCGRAAVPEVGHPVGFEVFAAGKAEDQQGVFFAERGGKAISDFLAPKAENIIAVVGPEGGWDDAEIGLAEEKGFALVTLGGRILRAETAGITVTALLQNIYGDLH